MTFKLLPNLWLSFSSPLIVIFLCVAGLILLLSLLRISHRIKPTLRKYFVIITNVCAFICLVFLSADIKHLSDTPLTYHAFTQDVSLVDINNADIGPDDRVFVFQGAFDANLRLNINSDYEDISSVDELIARIETSDVDKRLNNAERPHIKVYGSGLFSSQWEKLQSLNITFIPAEKISGLVDPIWQQHLALGQPLQFSAKWQQVDDNKTNKLTAQLIDIHDNVVDEKPISRGERFSLSSIAKTHGQFIYQVRIKRKSTLLAQEPVAFTVENKPTIKMAIAQSAPSFETKHLKNWLAKQGGQYIVDTLISKNNSVKQQNFGQNTQVTPSKNQFFTENGLSYYDLLVVDTRLLMQLNKNALFNITRQIERGLGLYLLVDDSQFATLQRKFPELLSAITLNSPTQIQSTNVMQVLWETLSEPLELTQTNKSISGNFKRKIVWSTNKRNLVVMNKLGLGAVGVSLINTSYQWQLSGFKTEYAHFWQNIISALSKPNQQSRWITSTYSEMAFTNTPQIFCAQLTDKEDFIENQNTLAVSQSQSHQCFTSFVNNDGWQNYEIHNEKGLVSTNSQFIYNEQQWQAHRQIITKKHSFSFTKSQHNNELGKYFVLTDKFWLWCFFVLIMSGLWLERKLYQA